MVTVSQKYIHVCIRCIVGNFGRLNFWKVPFKCIEYIIVFEDLTFGRMGSSELLKSGVNLAHVWKTISR